HLEYVPDAECVELKSLKLYIWAYRGEGAFHEAVTNRIVDALVSRLAPRFLRLTAEFNVRGGICTTVVVEHRQEGWKGTPAGFAERIGSTSAHALHMYNRRFREVALGGKLYAGQEGSHQEKEEDR